MNGLGFIDLSLSRASAHWKCPGSPGPLGVKACRRTGSHVMWPGLLSFLSGLSVNQMEKFKCLLSHCLRFLKPGLSQMNLLKFMKTGKKKKGQWKWPVLVALVVFPSCLIANTLPAYPLIPNLKQGHFSNTPQTILGALRTVSNCECAGPSCLATMELVLLDGVCVTT